MQTDLSGGPGLAVVAGDVLALRGTGLAAAETWALLCQAAQALQDLFLSNGGVVGGSRVGPVVTPHTLELTPRGRVLLQLAPPETARAYLPPEYRPGRVYSDTDSEKMWMYSLGRALLDTTPRVAALTGTVSVSPSSALQSVLAAMTEPDPRRRASLMNLLDVISEYCRTRLQSKPFTHIVMDMYREVIKSPQYTARKRMAYQHLNPPPPLRNPSDLTEHNRRQSNYPHHHHHHQQAPQQLDPLQSMHNQAKNLHQDRPYHTTNQYNHPPRTVQTQYQSQQHHQQHQESHQAQIPKIHHYHHHHPAKGALFKLQSRNSHSHPNLTSLCGQQLQPNRRQETEDRRTAHFQSQLNVQATGRPVVPVIHHQRRHHHSRTYSQPIYTRLQHTRSSGNLPSTVVGESNNHPGNVYSDPIYALPVKPFLSSQDVRVNGLSVKPPVGHRNEDMYTATTIARRPSVAGYSHPDIATSSTERTREEVYGRSAGRMNSSLQRQHSNPQLPSRDQRDEDFERVPDQNVATTDHRCPAGREKEEQIVQQQNPVSSMRVRSVQGPPKPPRIITTLKKSPFSDVESSKSEPPAKPPRNLVKNGPRARRGKAVQRAPSRLYRAVGGPTRSFNKAQCVGPEFVIRANQPPKTLCVGQVKAANSGRIVVIMLTGQRVEVTCDPQKVTAGDLFQAIVQAESLDENFTLGLAVLLAGDFAILPPDTKLNKVAPPGWLSSGKSKGLLGLPTSFMLYLRLRFFLPSLRGVRSWISKHLLYLQIRRCILEQQLVCPYPELINLTGLALQAEFGNYNVNEHGCGDYFLLEHYVPESLILNIDQHQTQINNGGAEALRGRLHQAHRDRRGLDSNKAEEMFITHAQTLPDYGSHYYIATVDSKELEKVMAQQRKRKPDNNCDTSDELLDSSENIYNQDGRVQEYQIRGRVEISRLGSCENVPKIPYNERKPPGLTKSATTNDIYGAHKSKYRVEACNNNNINNVNHNNNNNNNNINHGGKSGKGGKKKTESNVWLAIHAQGLKLFERGGEPRERIELAQFQWKDIQTLSYSKSCLVVYSKVNGKRCKFKLRMDHRKSYFAFKLTSLHHQFFLRLRSELTSLQGLAKEFGVPMTVETKPSPSKSKSHDTKTKIAIANTVKNAQLRPTYTMQLEEYQNKENENPQKDVNAVPKTKDPLREPGFYSSEEDALYAQVNVRLEPEGESRDTENESERSLTGPSKLLSLDTKGMKNDGKLYNCPRIELDTEIECGYSLPKIMSSNDVDQLEKTDNPEELYAAINKVGITRKNEFPVPDEVWDVSDVKKSLHKMKTSSLPNYGTPRQAGGYRTPSLPRRLGVKMGTRAIYSSLVQKDTALTDDMESLSLKSDTESSIQSLSARSTESPLPEAYVLNADIRTNDETFHVTEDESMSASLAARLEELSFAEERILQTIKLERGHGGSIGLQVTEGNDGGVYVQAVSVGGSADMAGNVNKGDRIVAINGQNLLHLRYEDALKMLQSSSDTIELVLSQAASRKNATSRQNREQPARNNYLNDIRFDVSSEADTSSMTNKWLVQRTTDVASVQNTSSAYSSAASSAMGNHNANSLYMADLVDNGALKSASMLLSIEDFDVSRTSRQVFI
ncbi:FERM and PDZ domain-containing protein 2 [Anthophora quadrimaculata]